MRKLSFLLIALFGCVGEDVVLDRVDPEARIINPIATLQVDTDYQFQVIFLDHVGMETTPESLIWSTSDASVAIVNQEGLVSALDLGEAIITLSAIINEIEVETNIMLEVTTGPTMLTGDLRAGKITSTSSYTLTGDFEIGVDENDLVIIFESNYAADTGLPGLYVYLTNNPNSPDGGYEIGPVEIFTGSHEYRIPNIDLFDFNYLFYYCKPFKVKVGHGDIE